MIKMSMSKLIIKKTEFKPGSVVPVSGIYTVAHDNDHMGAHEVTCVKGNRFPTCRTCGNPRFKLFLEAVHFDEHPSLTPVV
jgi:hypothetical protein